MVPEGLCRSGSWHELAGSTRLPAMFLPRVRAAFGAARGRRLVRMTVALLIASAGIWASPRGTASVAASDAPLPACRYDDVYTLPRSYAAWSTTLVDTILRVGKGYVPPDLVKTSEAGIGGGGMIREVAVDDLRAMTDAAATNGTPIAVQSSYRSYTTQVATFQHWVDISSYSQALRSSARPGHSEHQLGVAIDFRSAAGGPPWSGTDWATSPAGAWMKAHAWEYGWVMSYPKGKFKLVCYDYEPWHYRYVGRDLATAIHASKLTIREYLWRHFTTVTVTGPAIATPSPSTPAPSLPATVAPSAEPTTASTSPAATLAPSGVPRASVAARSPSPAAATSPPARPAGSLLEDDGTVLVAAALAVAAIALAGSLAMARRRSSAPPR